nr:hypothetical protein [Tanacetum cinerariifolium]
RLTTPRHHVGLRNHSPTPQGTAVAAVQSFDRHHDGGLAADNPYSTPNHINRPPDLFISFYNRRNLHAWNNRREKQGEAGEKARMAGECGRDAAASPKKSPKKLFGGGWQEATPKATPEFERGGRKDFRVM